MEKTKEKLMRTAIEITAESGLESVTVRRIADKMEVSEATLYRHFISRDELLRETFLWLDGKMSSYMLHLLQKDDLDSIQFYKHLDEAWLKIFQYLITNGQDACFLRRFRSSGYCTPAVQKKRLGNQGEFRDFLHIAEKWLPCALQCQKGFLMGYIFNFTLSFAEGVISGEIENTEENLRRIEQSILASVVTMVNLPEEAHALLAARRQEYDQYSR